MTSGLPTSPPSAPKVEYYAISILQSRTAWLNFAALVVAILSATEVVTIIPTRFLPLSSAILASANIWLRLNTVRPAALIGPGEVKPVLVPKVGPPPPPLVSD